MFTHLGSFHVPVSPSLRRLQPFEQDTLLDLGENRERTGRDREEGGHGEGRERKEMCIG